MSEDPKDFDAGDYNLYRYCHNDPEDHTDAMGLEGNNVSVTDWKGLHIEQELEQRERAGLDTTAGRALQSAEQGLAMAQAQLQGKNSSVIQAQSLGPGATITRSVVDSGVDYPEGFYSRPWVYFKYVLQDDGKPAPAGIHVSENVSLVNKEGMPRYFIVTAPGTALPRYSAPLISPTGHATFVQTFSLETGARATFEGTMYAVGAFVPNTFSATFH